MQSFRYHVPSSSRRPLFGKRPPSPWKPLGVVLAVAALGGGLWWGLPAGAKVAGSLGAMLMRPAGAAERDRHAETLLRDGETHMAKSEFLAAISCFDQAIALADSPLAYRRALDARYLQAAMGADVPAWPDDLDTLLARGAYEQQAGRLAAALAAYDAAAAKAPKDARPQLGRARVLVATHHEEDALGALEQAHQLAPSDQAVTVACMEAQSRSGDGHQAIAEAIETFRAEAGHTDDEVVQVGLLDAYMRQGLTTAELRARHMADAPQIADAARDYFLAQAAMRHYRRNPHWHQDAFEQVVSACRRVLATKDAVSSPWRAKAGALLAQAYATRAQGFLERSDFEAARVQLAHALSYGRYLDAAGRADLHVQQARLLPLLGRPDAAMAELAAALRLNPQHPCRSELGKWNLHLGTGLLSANRPQEAVKPLTAALQQLPLSPEALAWRVLALKRTHDDAPLTASAKLIGLPLAEARVRLALGWLAIGRQDEAAQAAADAAKAGAPPALLEGLNAELAIARGQRTSARKALLQAIEHQPTQALWARLGEVDEALAKSAKPAEKPVHQQRAREDYAHALALAGDDAVRGHLLGLTKGLAEQARDHGDWAGTHRLAGGALLLAPGNPSLSVLDGDALSKLGKAEEARSAYEAALAGLTRPGTPAGAVVRQRLGDWYLAAKQYEPAVTWYREGLSPEVNANPPMTAALYYGLTRALWESGKREDAVEAAHQYLFWSFHDPEEAHRVPEIQKLESQLARS